jgi:hypothetical protein
MQLVGHDNQIDTAVYRMTLQKSDFLTP